MLSIVMPTYWHIEYTKEALINLRKVLPKDSEIIVIDDGSTDWTVEFLEKQKDIIFINNKVNKWVTYSWNLWVETAKWDYICVINNDVVFPEWFFEKLIDWFKDNPSVFACIISQWILTNFSVNISSNNWPFIRICIAAKGL